MPENESLMCDALAARRWRPVKQQLESGLPLAEAFPEIESAFYRWLRKVWNQWRSRGVDAGELVAAVLGSRDELEQLIERCGHDPNAKLLGEVASGIDVRDAESLIAAFLDRAWEQARCVLRLDCREDMPNFELSGRIRGMLDRICRPLVQNPSRFPPLPRRRAAAPDLDDLLKRALLN